MQIISEHISYAEGIFSQKATDLKLDNTPNADQLDAMQYVAENVFERVRANFKSQLRINSFFRNQKVNKAVGGSATSQHTKGEAIDITGVPYGVRNSAIYNYIKDNLDFDQLIWEFGTRQDPSWVHVSLVKGMNRRSILRAEKNGTKTVYVKIQ